MTLYTLNRPEASKLCTFLFHTVEPLISHNYRFLFTVEPLIIHISISHSGTSNYMQWNF